MDNLNEQQVRSIVQDEMNKNNRSGSPVIPPHFHNGNDALQVQGKYLQYNNKFATDFRLSGGGVTGSQQMTIANAIFNPTKLYFSGIARTPLIGSATTKCQITGVAEIGNCFFIDQSGRAPVKVPVINGNTCTTFVNAGGSPAVWTPTVNVDDTHFVAVFDGSFSLVMSIDVISYTNTSITLELFADAAWSFDGGLIIT